MTSSEEVLEREAIVDIELVEEEVECCFGLGEVKMEGKREEMERVERCRGVRGVTGGVGRGDIIFLFVSVIGMWVLFVYPIVRPARVLFVKDYNGNRDGRKERRREREIRDSTRFELQRMRMEWKGRDGWRFLRHLRWARRRDVSECRRV